MATPQFIRNPQTVQRSIITIRGRAFAVRTQGQCVDVFWRSGHRRHFPSMDAYREWVLDRLIAFSELDRMSGGEAA